MLARESVSRKNVQVTNWLMSLLTLVAAQAGSAVGRLEVRALLEAKFPDRKRGAVPEPAFFGRKQLKLKHHLTPDLRELLVSLDSGGTGPNAPTYRGHAEDDIARTVANATLVSPGVPTLDVGGNAERTHTQGWTNVDTIINGCCISDTARITRWRDNGISCSLSEIYEVPQWYEKTIAVDSIYYWSPEEFIFAILVGGGHLETVEQVFDLTKKSSDRYNRRHTEISMHTEQVSFNNRTYLVSHAARNADVYAQPLPLFGDASIISVYHHDTDITYFIHRRFLSQYNYSYTYSYELYTCQGDKSGLPMTEDQWVEFRAKSDDAVVDVFDEEALHDVTKDEMIEVTVRTFSINGVDSTITATDNLLVLEVALWQEFLGIIVPNIDRLDNTTVRSLVNSLAKRLGDANSQMLLLKYFESLAHNEHNWIAGLIGQAQKNPEVQARKELMSSIKSGDIPITVEGYTPRLWVKAAGKIVSLFKNDWHWYVWSLVPLTVIVKRPLASQFKITAAIGFLFLSAVISCSPIDTVTDYVVKVDWPRAGQEEVIELLLYIAELMAWLLYTIVMPLGYWWSAVVVAIVLAFTAIAYGVTRLYGSVVSRHFRFRSVVKGRTSLTGGKVMSTAFTKVLIEYSREYSTFWIGVFLKPTGPDAFCDRIKAVGRPPNPIPTVSYESYFTAQDHSC